MSLVRSLVSVLLTTSSLVWALRRISKRGCRSACCQPRPPVTRSSSRARNLGAPCRIPPASVAVTTSEVIANQNPGSVYDVLDRTPNIAVNGNRTSFSIRGIDAFSVSGGGDGPLASVYLDGAPLPRSALTIGPLDLYDIAQVEVFRGPQSTVQGRNALAGAVIIRTADPTYDWSGRTRLMITGKSGERRAGGAIGGPIVDGQIAFRVAGEIARNDGLIFNQTTGKRRRPPQIRDAARQAADHAGRAAGPAHRRHLHARPASARHALHRVRSAL